MTLALFEHRLHLGANCIFKIFHPTGVFPLVYLRSKHATARTKLSNFVMESNVYFYGFSPELISLLIMLDLLNDLYSLQYFLAASKFYWISRKFHEFFNVVPSLSLVY